ncbi:MAG: galactokinase [Adlercreutzia sp.]|nr:galactokinase [Adlercreutzia sp.]
MPESQVEAQKLAYLEELFAKAFGEASSNCRPFFVLASAPGRMEVAGNHVDHQGGRVISAAIAERTWGLAAPNGTGRIRAVMEGFGVDEIDLDEAGWDVPRKVERQEPGALVRGMAAAFAAGGGQLRGFDLVTCSDVPPGCGLSSSAAFEVMVGACLEGLFGGAAVAPDGFLRLDPVALALAGVDAEQRFFGKPCGAQDQLASACGGAVLLDFAEAVPTVTPIEFDAARAGFAAVLVDSRQDHSLHNDEFAAIPADMRMVANALGASRLGDIEVDALLSRIGELRAELGDRRVMRALHYFDEVDRVNRQAAALAAGDFGLFLRCVRLSGASSAQFLQNVSLRDPGSETRQPAMVIQSLAAHLLGERGAWRIHGGGFGGSVLAFVPADEAAAFTEAMDGLLGYEACRQVEVGGAGVRARRLS